MKKLIILLSLLSGCAVVPVTRHFPEAPKELQVQCKQLQTIDKPQVLLSELTKTVVNNYTQYYDCAALVDAWNKWYIDQKMNFDSVK